MNKYEVLGIVGEGELLKLSNFNRPLAAFYECF